MSGITRIPAGDSSDNVRRIGFRRSGQARPDPGALARQAKIALLAFEAFGSREAACAFVNDIHVVLGGRPIEIAGSSDSGFASVAAVIVSHAEMLRAA